ncbi:MAG: endo-1,4-beta-xylanase [Granulosicoccus sp.]
MAAVQACSSDGGMGQTTAPPDVDAPIVEQPVEGTTGAGEPVQEPTDDPVGSGGTTAPIDIPANQTLPPLPNPPLTPAPGSDSEPLRATGPVSTVTEFFLLRDPTRSLEDTFGVLTDEDFAAGPLPAIVQTPADVNPASNAAPYFDSLTDVEVFAGEELTVVFRPLDPDGGIPGLFPNAIPAGARYVDNFNGTRSLIWRPLQPDVGIREFTITATDPVSPFYRTQRTIRIKIKMPADPDSIINLPPAINLIRPHTVRVGDPVVMYIKVTDPNGTIPELEITNLPPGATLVAHHSEPDISILRFVPDSAQLITLQMLVRDAIDPGKTGTKTTTLEVLDADEFTRPGASLKELASARDLLIGYASLLNFYYRPDGALYADIAEEEFNFVSSENSLKWDFVNPLPGKYRWAGADNLVNFAKARRLSVHGHTLIWHRQLPGWIQRSALSDRETHMREYIDRVLQRYGDDIPVWDVVNEAIDEDGTFRNSTWFEAMGASFIDKAFKQARLSAPDATLLYNDYDIGFAGPKSDAMISLMQALKDADTPVDGVGFQLHLFADFDRFAEVEATFQKVAELDLDIYITELDVSMQNAQTEQQQAEVYEQILSLCLDQPRCKAFQTWGFTDMYSWRREFNPLLLDERYQTKPAYLALQKRLGEN